MVSVFRSFVCLLVCSCSGLAYGGEITRKDTLSEFKWKSTECRKPLMPLMSSGMSDQDRIVKYARDIELYINCLQREAQRDFEETQMEIQEAIERDLEEETRIMNDMMLNAAKTTR